jgi:hypothetical protein
MFIDTNKTRSVGAPCFWSDATTEHGTPNGYNQQSASSSINIELLTEF